MAGRKYISTTLGPIDSNLLGVTLVHEHLLFDLSFMFTQPGNHRECELAEQPIRLDNLHWIRTHAASNRDNARLTDETDALEDMVEVKRAGVRSVVDVSMRGVRFAFNPAAVKRMALQVGLQVITGTGYYIDLSIPEEVKNQSVEQIAEELIRDLNEGYPEADFCAGVVGEIGTSLPITVFEDKVLQAAAIAQRKTGCALYIHPGYSEAGPMEVANRIQKYGVDPHKVVLCHVDSRLCGDIKTYCDLARCGFYLGFDTFGREQYIHLLGKQHPSDAQRIEWIKHLWDADHLDRVLISVDICWKSELAKYGGYGRSYIMREIVPRMRQTGFTEEAINQVLVKNPVAVLARWG
jgi:phosphotriesterase-related protein